MSQFVSQDLFDRMAFALVINTDPDATDARSAEAVSRFLHDVRDAFPGDRFTDELFQAARWLSGGRRENFGPDPALGFEAIRAIFERCQHFFPSGGRRPTHTSDTQPLQPPRGERLTIFMANVSQYALQTAV